MSAENPKSIMICGESGHGKSCSLLGIQDREDVLYFNCEGGKPLPFKNKFKKKTITDPEDIIDFLEELERLQDDPDEEQPFNFVVIDTVSFMMDMYETVHVIGSANTQKAWGNYAQFFRRLINQSAKVDAFFIFLGHLDTWLDEEAGYMRSAVPVKGALSKKGLEAFFTTVINVSKQKVKDLKKTPNDLLDITEEDEELGYKHVFQTRTTKQTVGDRIRSPLGLFERDQLYIDNDVFPVLKRLTEYYAD